MHKLKVNDIKADIQRKIMISIANDHRMNLYDLEEGKIVGKLKTSNSKLRTIAINEELKRLYASSFEF